MNPEILEQWIQVLPKYDQCFYVLRDGNKFCPLGVLCDLYKADEWDNNSFLGQLRVLPWQVAEWAEMDVDLILRVMRWNDKEKLTFSQIIAKIQDY